MRVYIILAVYVCCVTTSIVALEEFFVLPSESTECPVNDTSRCNTLSHYVGNSDQYFRSSTVFTFMNGIHGLNRIMEIFNIDNLSLLGKRSDEQHQGSIIQCNASIGTAMAGIVAMNISFLQIRNLGFFGCWVEMNQEQLLLSKYTSTFLNFSLPLSFGLYFNYIHNLEMSSVEVHKSRGYGMLGFNLLGDTTIDSVHFETNNYETLNDSECYTNPSLKCKGGNLVIVYTDLLECPDYPERYSLTIKNSSFIGGVDSGISYVTWIVAINRNDLQYINGGGVGLHMMQSSYGVDAVVINCTMKENAAYTGANMYMSMWDMVDNSTITVKNCTLNDGLNPFGNSVQIAGSYDLATGFYYNYGLLPLGSHVPVCSPTAKYQTVVLSLEDCEISGNNATLASAGYIQKWPKTFLEHPRELRLKNLRFKRNNGDATIVMIGHTTSSLAFRTYIADSIFESNFYERTVNSIVGSSSHQAVFQIADFNIEYENCTWIENDVTGLHAVESRVIFSGENQFIDNTAKNGGGLNIEEGSELFLQPGSKTYFIGNHAEEYGGAVFGVMLNYRCFFQFNSFEPFPSLFFTNNTANFAGDAVYGNIRVCLLQHDSYADDSYHFFLQISHFAENISSSPSTLSSQANRLCHCLNGIPNCDFITASFYIIESYPGKVFQVGIQALSDANDMNTGGQTPADINAVIVSNTSYAAIGNGASRYVPKGCSNVSYIINGHQNQTVDISLAPITNTIFFPVYIRVILQTCPKGFPFSNETLTCGCAQLLTDNGITCDIQTFSIRKTSSQWIGFINSTGGHYSLAVGSCTEPEYCDSSEANNLTFTEFDYQCINSHSGILCGQCLPGLSLTLGSSDCLKCSNMYLALLIFFAIAGFLWIAFLSIFDVTVNTGRINGMLFYANVIKLANFEFFRLRQSPFLIFQIMINWINLDFGIVSCFYNGFDYYAKTWLNFAFPIYLFALLGGIIYAAHISSKFSKLLPRNMLSVTSTLALICFTKLLRASSFSFPGQTIQTEEGDHFVWRFDGNIVYFGEKHGPLMVFSILVFILVVLPFAVILISYPFLWSFTKHENTWFESFVCYFRKKIFKMKPFLETYDGPYLTKYRYYTGLLVVLRLIIYFITASVYTSDSQVWFKSTAVSVICIVLLGVLVTCKIYVCPVNLTVEFLYLVNLTILEFLVLVLQLTGQEDELQGAVVSFSIAVGFITFVGVLIYEKYLTLEPHIYKKLGKKYVPRKHLCIAIRAEHESDRSKMSGFDDQVSQVLAVIDERRDKEIQLEVNKQEQLIQNLINQSDNEHVTV